MQTGSSIVTGYLHQYLFASQVIHTVRKALSPVKKLPGQHQNCFWKLERRQWLCWCDSGMWGWSTGGSSQGGLGSLQSILSEPSEEEQAPSSSDIYERNTNNRLESSSFSSSSSSSSQWKQKNFPKVVLTPKTWYMTIGRRIVPNQNVWFLLIFNRSYLFTQTSDLRFSHLFWNCLAEPDAPGALSRPYALSIRGGGRNFNPRVI